MQVMEERVYNGRKKRGHLNIIKILLMRSDLK